MVCALPYNRYLYMSADLGSSVRKDGACVTYTIYDKSPDIEHRETTVMCAGDVGLPVEARTLYRTLPEPTTDTECMYSCNPSVQADR